jgi:hypothetical protein
LKHKWTNQKAKGGVWREAFCSNRAL